MKWLKPQLETFISMERVSGACVPGTAAATGDCKNGGIQDAGDCKTGGLASKNCKSGTTGK